MELATACTQKLNLKPRDHVSTVSLPYHSISNPSASSLPGADTLWPTHLSALRSRLQIPSAATYQKPCVLSWVTVTHSPHSNQNGCEKQRNKTPIKTQILMSVLCLDPQGFSAASTNLYMAKKLKSPKKDFWGKGKMAQQGKVLP